VQHLAATNTTIGWLCVSIFAVAYAMVMLEERLHLRKSVPVMLAAGVIWVLIAIAAPAGAPREGVTEALRHNLLEFGELFLFLLAAITYVNTLEERNVFDALRAWLVRRGWSLRKLFWATGALAFCISPVADNLTTTLVMGTVAITLGAGQPRFVTVACINIVVAANAGGAFSPFGDITTLMVWQKGVVAFTEFFALFLPSLVNWLVPAAILSFAVGDSRPEPRAESAPMRRGAGIVLAMFIGTIAATVVLHTFLHLPPALGMMTGLGALKWYSYRLARTAGHAVPAEEGVLGGIAPHADERDSFDVFRILERIEWDTLMFFYGVILCVGGLGALGYLALLADASYGTLGPTAANIIVGLASAVIDNIPMMFAVLSMNPEMSHAQWLLVTLTAGVGGSLLSIGSAAGVALMGQARGTYTFMSHLRWSWAVALGYAAAIGMHLLVNGR
jgi:Na+/H+ antiporter NhaD/arsenite permease-like protein